MIREAIEYVVSGRSLSREEASQTMEEIMTGNATPAQLGALVTAMLLKGETADELAGMAQVMREKSLHVSVEGPLLDTCGTGGDSSGTFNISTTSGFVVAGTGIKVAKHGNRAMSSASGSADVLEELGVKIDLSPKGVQQCLNEVGFGFMFAQIFHPSMRFAAGPRKEIGIRTVFNMLGPLTNPAGATSQLIGVSNSKTGELIANVLNKLGSSHALVVHGADGLDEVTLEDFTYIWELNIGSVSAYTITPEELHLERIKRQDILAANTKESARMVQEVLQGQVSPARKIVLANAASALLAGDHVTSLKEGIVVAAESIDSGAAKNKLDALIELSLKLE